MYQGLVPHKGAVHNYRTKLGGVLGEYNRTLLECATDRSLATAATAGAFGFLLVPLALFNTDPNSDFVMVKRL